MVFIKLDIAHLKGRPHGYSYRHITHPAIESDLNKIQSVSPELDLD